MKRTMIKIKRLRMNRLNPDLAFTVDDLSVVSEIWVIDEIKIPDTAGLIDARLIPAGRIK